MAYYHHPHSAHHPTCCCRCSCCASSHPSLLSPSPSPSLSDSLLQIIASHLLQSPPPSFQPKYQHQHQHHQQTQTQTQTQNQTQPQSLLLLQSLLSRVSALESSLHHLSSPPSQTPPPPPPPSPFPSLRHLAARTIQTHFRAFLVRRSQTLRNLKDLATIRSNFASLRSSLQDNKTRLTPDAVSRKASELLIKLDSIQSRDSLINEGKRAIRAELYQFLDTVEGLSSKCCSSLPPKLKKNVSFAENPIPPSFEASRNIKSGGESDGVREFFSVEENEEDGRHPEMEGFHNQVSDEINARRHFIGGGSHEANGIFHGLKGNFQGQNANFGFDHSCELPNMGMGNEYGYGMNGWGYAPWPMNGDLGKLGFTASMPVQMEKRASDYLKKERLFDMPAKW